MEHELMLNAENGPIEELTTYCRQVGRWPQGWAELKAPRKREAFRRMFCTEATEGVDPVDKLQGIADRVENLEREAVPDAIARLTEEVGERGFELGGVLSRVVAEGWYKEFGYRNFKDWVAAETDFRHSKARYLINIYDKLVELDLPWSRFDGIGWSKVKVILPVIRSDNVDEWVEKAKRLTREQLEAELRSARGAAEGGERKDQKLFRIQGDPLETVEATLRQVRAELPTEHDAVALEHICETYLSRRVDLSDLRAASVPGLDTLEGCSKALRDVYSAIRKLAGSPYEAILPIVNVFEEVFSKDEVVMDVTADDSPFEDQNLAPRRHDTGSIGVVEIE